MLKLKVNKVPAIEYTQGQYDQDECIIYCPADINRAAYKPFIHADP
jgi:hypothetical protein